MNVDLGQLAVGLVPAAISAWVAGKIGIRHGLERAKRERAFDRRLAWHENAIAAVNRFRYAVFDLRNSPPERAIPLLKRLEENIIELDITLEKSVLFAERETVVELRETIEILGDLLMRVRDAIDDDAELADVSEMAQSFARSFRKLSFSLSQSVRRQLNLDEIILDDLKTEDERFREETQGRK
jgi:hypothetical protein